jgi:hypothetical protein
MEPHTSNTTPTPASMPPLTENTLTSAPVLALIQTSTPAPDASLASQEHVIIVDAPIPEREHPTKKPEKLTDLGFSGCYTCNDDSCHANVTSRSDFKELNVRVQRNRKTDGSINYIVTITALAGEENYDPDDMSVEYFNDESELVEYLHEDFRNFRCF